MSIDDKEFWQGFTDDSIKVIIAGQDESRRLGRNYFGTENLLVGLARYAIGPAAMALAAAGISWTTVREQLQQLDSTTSVVGVDIPYSARCRNTLERAVQLARELSDQKVDSRHLLLALLENRTGGAHEILSNMKVNNELLRQSIL